MVSFYMFHKMRRERFLFAIFLFLWYPILLFMIKRAAFTCVETRNSKNGGEFANCCDAEVYSPSSVAVSASMQCNGKKLIGVVMGSSRSAQTLT